MNRSPKRFSPLQVAFLGGAIATTATLTVLGPLYTSSVRAALQDSPKTVLDEAWQIVNREYVDGTFNHVDWRTTRTSLLDKNYASREQAYDALRAALKQLGDPYTRFLDPKQYESLTNQTSGELSGVGLQLELDEKTQMLTVVRPIDNSPAIKAGIKKGDRILAIDGKSTTGLSVEAAAQLIRGPLGTNVTLRIGRDHSNDFDQTLKRERIELETVTASLKQEGNQRIGYIYLREFSSHAADQMRRAIKDLGDQNVAGYVLDLRGNPGGLLQASIEIARMWIDTGSIVRTIDRQGNKEDLTANRTSITNLPLAILVDAHSASASEILAGAMKDNGRAKIIGTKTFGKALVQSVHPLSDGSGVSVTIAHYYTPNGTDISHKGITPDVEVGLTEEQQQILAANPKLIATLQDPQYAQAIATLKSENPTHSLGTN